MAEKVFSFTCCFKVSTFSTSCHIASDFFSNITKQLISIYNCISQELFYIPNISISKGLILQSS